MKNNNTFGRINDTFIFDSCPDCVHNHDDSATVDKVLTNFVDVELCIYKEALAIYGKPDMYISDIAYDISDRRVDGLKSLHAIGNKDRSAFWRIFDRVRDNHQ